MTVSEALYTRRSKRAFLPDPIPRDIMLDILNDAARTPSAGNTQPWEVYVAEGETLKRIKAGYANCYAYAVKADPELPLPSEWTEDTKRRKQGLFPEMVRDSGEAVHQFGTLNQSMFNAAAVVYICMDKILSHWSVYDIGAYSQSFMLSALEHGLGTVPAVTLVIYPEVIRKELNLPGNLQIIAGIAVGYTDETNSINNITSSRSPIEENVRFCD